MHIYNSNVHSSVQSMHYYNNSMYVRVRRDNDIVLGVNHHTHPPFVKGSEATVFGICQKRVFSLCAI